GFDQFGQYLCDAVEKGLVVMRRTEILNSDQVQSRSRQPAPFPSPRPDPSPRPAFDSQISNIFG
ncbi:MAG TPA: hypothetical protein VMT00_06705, partial [Thermoanaerobaculia bacterium]|nr:hypothetical protein [Thermoanaerobaculia bacterium]